MKSLAVPAAVCLFFCASTGANAQCSLADLQASDGAAGDEFGASLVLDGDWAIVGAANADRGGTDRGAVYAYERDGTGGWIERQVLLPSDPADFDRFGWSLALEDDLLVVGVLSDDDLGFDSGSAYVFEHDGTGWVETQKLIASDGGLGDLFGISVAISEGRVIVGACQRSLFELFGIGEGMVYVFERTGSAFVEVAELIASDRAPGDFFGASVDVDGDRIVVGAEGEDQAGGDAGALYVFDDISGSWQERAKLTASDGAAGDFLGMRVRVQGQHIVAGAPTADVAGAVDAGAVYVFEGNGGGTNWTEVGKVIDPAPDDDDQLGLGLDLDGELLLVGGPGAGPGDVGRAQLLRDDGSFVVVASFEGGATGDALGAAAAVDGDRLLLGASAEGGPGAAHEFLHVRATSVVRGAAGNPGSLTMPAPVLGTSVAAVVDLGGTTGHPLAGLFGFAGPASLTLGGGQVLLVDLTAPGGELLGQPLTAGPSAVFPLVIPDDPAVCGAALSMQAVHLGGPPFALSNALDVVLGS